MELKFCFEFEKYIDIKSKPFVKNNVKEYSGNYESEDTSRQTKLNIMDDRIEGRN